MRQRGKARCLVLLVLQYGMAVLLQNHQERNRAKVPRARPVEGAAPRPAAPLRDLPDGGFRLPNKLCASGTAACGFLLSSRTRWGREGGRD